MTERTLGVALAVWLVSASACTQAQAYVSVTEHTQQVIPSSIFEPFMCLNDTVQSGESLYQLLTQNGFSPLQSLQIINATEHVDHLAKNYPGERFTMLIDLAGEPFELRYHRLDGRRVIVGGTSESYWSLVDIPSDSISLLSASGVLESSLYLAFMEEGLKPELLLQFADVFSWTVDFLTECRVGDRFRVVFTEEERTGRIELLGASYEKRDRTYVAISLKGPDGKTEYYAPNGTNMRKAFLRSPLNYRRISSGFSRARFHPILKRYRPHLGVDYAAATGTPVVSIGDGLVEYAGWNGGFGNYVKVKHTGGCATSYGHLSHYGRGIRRGVRVSQGQVIGYVGSTGLSTGPHLDFRIYLSGRPVNPLRFSAPPAPPVDDDRKAELTFLAFLTRQIMDDMPNPEGERITEKLQPVWLPEAFDELAQSLASFCVARPYSLASILRQGNPTAYR